MSKTKKYIYVALIIFACIFTVVWQMSFSQKTSYYFVAAVILVASTLPFFMGFEKSKPSAREMSLIAILIALAVASRAVFYLIPQFKPIGAVVIACAVCLGSERGYVIGAFSAFVSNFIFGQGIWTPFQMAALGMVGFVAGLIFKKIKPNRVNLALVGFLLTFALYGLIVDLSSVLTMTTDYSIASVLAIYAAGVPFSAVFGGATALFLFLFGEDFVKKINRINIKYGIIANKV